MVIDAGGGTIDITVHKPNEDGTLIEVHPPSGGDWGSTNVNKEFIRVLEELYGADFLNSIKGTEYWLEVIDSFEVLMIINTLQTIFVDPIIRISKSSSKIITKRPPGGIAL